MKLKIDPNTGTESALYTILTEHPLTDEQQAKLENKTMKPIPSPKPSPATQRLLRPGSFVHPETGMINHADGTYELPAEAQAEGKYWVRRQRMSKGLPPEATEEERRPRLSPAESARLKKESLERIKRSPFFRMPQ